MAATRPAPTGSLRPDGAGLAWGGPARQRQPPPSSAPPVPPDNADQLLRQLEWTVLRRLDGLLQGGCRTLLRGAGMDLADLREYQCHDDVRHIDWNVTARLQAPYVRVFTEDREISAWFVLDLSASMDFGASQRSKRQVSTELVGVLARLLSRHGHRVGALLCGAGSIEAVIPARSGRPHVLQLLHTLQARPLASGHGQASGPTRLQALLQAAAPVLRRRATVFVLSDFISEPGWEAPLGQLALRHDVLAVRLLDPLERELPDLGLMPVRDLETGEQLLVDTHDADFRKRFAWIAAQREARLRQALGRAGVDTLELSTEDDLVEAVVRLTELRKRRKERP